MYTHYIVVTFPCFL